LFDQEMLFELLNCTAESAGTWDSILRDWLTSLWSYTNCCQLLGSCRDHARRSAVTYWPLCGK